MKTLLTILILLVSASFCPAGVINCGFEDGMNGWTHEFTNDGTNGGHSCMLSTGPDYHYSGNNALWGRAQITGDQSAWWQDDFCRIYIWSDCEGLEDTTSISFQLTDFQSNYSHLGWGWGQEVFLVLSDGTNTAQSLLFVNHEYPFGTPQPYTTSIGGDGRTWCGFNVPLTKTCFGDEILDIDMSEAKYGFCWEAISWNNCSQTLWSGCAIDDCHKVPEPGTIVLLITGLIASGLFYLRRK